MKLVMTIMVRDEADIVAAMLEHHLAQGVDRFVVTDNGSIDGTTAILQAYADRGLVDLRHDPVHRKQQSSVVSGMASDAFTQHEATWVINADADEFWVAVDPTMTLREALERWDPAIRAVLVPVVDMTGDPALEGSGLSRLTYRDHRSVEEINRIGLHAHATADVIHVGRADVSVMQGNHFVDMENGGDPPEDARIEVLHLPWRSWRQYRGKVEKAGRAYDANPELTPSPNHHGMRDWRRLQEGTLFGWYLARHPGPDALRAGLEDGRFVRDDRLASLDAPTPDVPLDATSREEIQLAFLAAERERARAERDAAVAANAARARIEALDDEAVALRRELARLRGLPLANLADRIESRRRR
jgi:hypothetical protein